MGEAEAQLDNRGKNPILKPRNVLAMQNTQGLSNLQLELLKMFSFNLSDTQLLEIKSILAAYFADKITQDVDTLFAEKGWGPEKIEEWAGEHMRTRVE